MTIMSKVCILYSLLYEREREVLVNAPNEFGNHEVVVAGLLPSSQNINSVTTRAALAK